MINHPELSYRQIKEQTLNETKELLFNREWSSLNTILNSCPEQIFLSINISEFEKTIKTEENFLLLK